MRCKIKRQIFPRRGTKIFRSSQSTLSPLLLKLRLIANWSRGLSSLYSISNQYYGWLWPESTQQSIHLLLGLCLGTPPPWRLVWLIALGNLETAVCVAMAPTARGCWSCSNSNNIVNIIWLSFSSSGISSASF